MKLFSNNAATSTSILRLGIINVWMMRGLNGWMEHSDKGQQRPSRGLIWSLANFLYL